MEPCSHLQGPIRSACPQVAHLLDSSPTDPFSQLRPDSPPGSRPPMPRHFSSPLASVASDHFPSSFIGCEVYTPGRKKGGRRWLKRPKETCRRGGWFLRKPWGKSWTTKRSVLHLWSKRDHHRQEPFWKLIFFLNRETHNTERRREGRWQKLCRNTTTPKENHSFPLVEESPLDN